MDFDTILGYRVKDSKIVEQAKKYNVNFYSVSYLGAVKRLIRRTGCPVLNFRMVRGEDQTEIDNDTMILTIYEGYKDKEDVDVEKILKKFPPIFERIKEDLGIEGGPEFYLGEP